MSQRQYRYGKTDFISRKQSNISRERDKRDNISRERPIISRTQSNVSSEILSRG